MNQPNAVSQLPSVDIYSALMQRSSDIAASESESFDIPIGTKADGTMLSADLEQITHMLVCGCSGTGKTSFIQTVVLYLARKHSPQDIKYIIIDSKAVDYSFLQKLPHLMMPIINMDHKADRALSGLQNESSRRLSLFQDHGVKDIASYNNQCTQSGIEKLPHILLIVDDFASIQIYKNYKIPASLISILQNGRITGIHVILVTSITSSRNLPRNLLTLIPYRVSFCVSERADSKLIIDKEDAEKLQVPGELLFSDLGTLQKCKGVYLTDRQMSSVFERIQRKQVLNLRTLGNMAEQIFEELAEPKAKERIQASVDDRFIRMALNRHVESGQISATMIIKQLNVSFAQAVKLIQQMETYGLIEKSEGLKPRRILLSPAQWEAVDKEYVALSSVQSFLETISIDTSSADEQQQQDEPPDIILRDFEEFVVDKVKLSVHDNLICISKIIVTPNGRACVYPQFTGNAIAGLIYKTPHLFSKGYIQFQMKPSAQFINDSSSTIMVKREELPELLTIQFGLRDEKTMHAFMQQIAEDIGMPLAEL